MIGHLTLNRHIDFHEKRLMENNNMKESTPVERISRALVTEKGKQLQKLMPFALYAGLRKGAQHYATFAGKAILSMVIFS